MINLSLFYEQLGDVAQAFSNPAGAPNPSFHKKNDTEYYMSFYNTGSGEIEVYYSSNAGSTFTQINITGGFASLNFLRRGEFFTINGNHYVVLSDITTANNTAYIYLLSAGDMAEVAQITDTKWLTRVRAFNNVAYFMGTNGDFTDGKIWSFDGATVSTFMTQAGWTTAYDYIDFQGTKVATFGYLPTLGEPFPGANQYNTGLIAYDTGSGFQTTELFLLHIRKLLSHQNNIHGAARQIGANGTAMRDLILTFNGFNPLDVSSVFALSIDGNMRVGDLYSDGLELFAVTYGYDNTGDAPNFQTDVYELAVYRFVGGITNLIREFTFPGNQIIGQNSTSYDDADIYTIGVFDSNAFPTLTGTAQWWLYFKPVLNPNLVYESVTVLQHETATNADDGAIQQNVNTDNAVGTVEYRVLDTNEVEVQTWQTNKVFTGLAPGTYLCEARDDEETVRFENVVSILEAQNETQILPSRSRNYVNSPNFSRFYRIYGMSLNDFQNLFGQLPPPIDEVAPGGLPPDILSEAIIYNNGTDLEWNSGESIIFNNS